MSYFRLETDHFIKISSVQVTAILVPTGPVTKQMETLSYTSGYISHLDQLNTHSVIQSVCFKSPFHLDVQLAIKAL